jgi:hypothetical protein
MPGTFEHSLHCLVDNELDLSIFDAKLRWLGPSPSEVIALGT